MLTIFAGLGIVTLVLGCLLLFNFPALKKLSHVMNQVIFTEAWVHDHRMSLGIVLLVAAAILFASVYFRMTS